MLAEFPGRNERFMTMGGGKPFSLKKWDIKTKGGKGRYLPASSLEYLLSRINEDIFSEGFLARCYFS